MTYEELTRKLRAAPPAPRRNYAVLTPVFEEEGALSLLFEVRSHTLRTQPGEVCFPGGRVEPGETPAQAALRETGEELGLHSPWVELGPALPEQWHQAGFCTHPFLGRLSPGWRDAIRPGRAEVEEVFSVPLDFFRRTPPERYPCETVTLPPPDFPYERIGFPQGYPWRKGHTVLPLWVWKERPIWGLTARMVLSLVETL